MTTKNLWISAQAYRDDTRDGTGAVPYKTFWIAAQHHTAMTALLIGLIDD